MLALPPTLFENVSPASYKLDSVPHAVLHTAIASHSLVLNRRTSGRACDRFEIYFESSAVPFPA